MLGSILMVKMERFSPADSASNCLMSDWYLLLDSLIDYTSFTSEEILIADKASNKVPQRLLYAKPNFTSHKKGIIKRKSKLKDHSPPEM